MNTTLSSIMLLCVDVKLINGMLLVLIDELDL
jgi:hypothetical protein